MRPGIRLVEELSGWYSIQHIQMHLVPDALPSGDFRDLREVWVTVTGPMLEDAAMALYEKQVNDLSGGRLVKQVIAGWRG